MNFGLIIVGDELLSGKRQDQHLQKVIALLSARGAALAWARYVGDDPIRLTADLRDALQGARAQGDVVFSCGGIGATPDDHTRQCAAAALGVPLQMNAQAQGFIVARMQAMAQEQGIAFNPDEPSHVHRLNMALFPQGAHIIPNPYNGIAGFSVQAGQGSVFFVPGFPVMAWPMIEWVLDHPCAHLCGAAPVPKEKSVIVIDGIEGALTPLMQALEAQFPGVKVFSLPSVAHPQWGRHVELGVKGVGEVLEQAYLQMMLELRAQDLSLGPELVR
jgi:molybdopterin-biosynthesis enzyme MoeA-like protein